MKIQACGDQAIIVDILPEDTAASGVSALATVGRLHQALLNTAGVIDLVPAAQTLLLQLDTQVLTPAAAAALVQEVNLAQEVALRDSAEITIPVNYAGPDLEVVAQHCGLSAAEVIEAHTNTVWTAAFGGFAPGFMYLVPDKPLFDIPRRDTPRTKIPAGAVGLAGEFSAVYPKESPGGWQLIGTTEQVMWDTERKQPALVMPGDTVRFVASSRK